MKNIPHIKSKGEKIEVGCDNCGIVGTVHKEIVQVFFTPDHWLWRDVYGGISFFCEKCLQKLPRSLRKEAMKFHKQRNLWMLTVNFESKLRKYKKKLTDKVKCPYRDELITRQECLDYSGEAKNYDECQGCETGKDTKERLIPRN